MKQVACKALIVTVLAALVPACSGSQPPLFTSSAVRSRASWMMPEAKSGDLVYVSGGDGLMVYSYPKFELVGNIAIYGTIFGLCSDRQGNIFAPTTDYEFYDGKVFEYVHGGTSPIATFDHAGRLPLSCSVDRRTGDLAVTNYCYLLDGSCLFGHGDLAVYLHGQGLPKHHGLKSFYYYKACGYDDKGDLFVDGADASSRFLFAELPRGGKRLKVVTLNQSINQPGGVQWDGKHVAVGDWTGKGIYEFDVRHGVGTKVGTTPLDGSGNTFDQFWIAGKEVVAPTYNAYEYTGVLASYAYPSGGAAKRTIALPYAPTGVTVSIAPR